MSWEAISALVAAATFLGVGITIIFRVGGQYAKFQIQLAEFEKAAIERDGRLRQEQAERYAKLLTDLNGIGASLRALRHLGDRRYHNSTMVHMINAEPNKRVSIAGMLREEIGE